MIKISSNGFSLLRSKLFNGKLKQSQVSGINTILAAINEYKLPDKRQAAYIFATAYHETAKTMQPVVEYGSDVYLRDKKYWPYIGRGYVQLTWKENYEKFTKLLGVNLVKNPALACDPEIAAKVMMIGMMKGIFTGKRLSDYISSLKCDYVGARRIINGTDRAEMVAGYARVFQEAIEAI